MRASQEHAPTADNLLKTRHLIALVTGLSAAIAFAAGSAEPAAEVEVREVPEYHEKIFSLAGPTARIEWTLRTDETRQEGLSHRLKGDLSLAQMVPYLAKLMRVVLNAESNPQAETITSLYWGRILPDWSRSYELSSRLALAAWQSPEWNRKTGRPKKKEINSWVKQLGNQAMIYPELKRVFAEQGRELEISDIEKVLVSKAGSLPFYDLLKPHGVGVNDKVPWDAMVYFSMRKSAPSP